MVFYNNNDKSLSRTSEQINYNNEEFYINKKIFKDILLNLLYLMNSIFRQKKEI